jgi:hypothetical protein
MQLREVYAEGSTFPDWVEETYIDQELDPHLRTAVIKAEAKAQCRRINSRKLATIHGNFPRLWSRKDSVQSFSLNCGLVRIPGLNGSDSNETENSEGRKVNPSIKWKAGTIWLTNPMAREKSRLFKVSTKTSLCL